MIVDDGGYGMLRFDQRQSGDPIFGVDLQSPDFAALAGSFGIETETVEGLGDDFSQALARHVADSSPTVLVARAGLEPPPTSSPALVSPPQVAGRPFGYHWGMTSHREQELMVEELREASFPMALRGYDRAAVDAYVEQVHRVIAEFEVSRSPESAVKNAVAQVTDETRGILERAHEAADEITARSRARADERVQEAEREAARLRQNAEAQVRELDSDVEAIWNERHRLIEDVRNIADQPGDVRRGGRGALPRRGRGRHAGPAADDRAAAAGRAGACPRSWSRLPDVEADVIHAEPPPEIDATEPEEPGPGP